MSVQRSSKQRPLNPIITPHPAVEAVEVIQDASPLSPLTPPSNSDTNNSSLNNHDRVMVVNNHVYHHSEPVDVLSPKLMSQALNFKDSVDFIVPEEEKKKNQ